MEHPRCLNHLKQAKVSLFPLSIPCTLVKISKVDGVQVPTIRRKWSYEVVGLPLLLDPRMLDSIYVRVVAIHALQAIVIDTQSQQEHAQIQVSAENASKISLLARMKRAKICTNTAVTDMPTVSSDARSTVATHDVHRVRNRRYAIVVMTVVVLALRGIEPK